MKIKKNPSEPLIFSPFFADSFEDHYVEWGEDDDWPQLGGDQGVDAVEQGVVPEQKHCIEELHDKMGKYHQINVGSLRWEDILYSTWKLIIKDFYKMFKLIIQKVSKSLSQ